MMNQIVGLLFLLCFYCILGTKCPTRICKCYKREADCSGHKKGLQYIPKLPPKIGTLRFAGNWLPNITRNTFDNVTTLKLTDLILGGNGIKNISRDAFEAFPHLKFLDFSGNQFSTSILHQSFYGLRNSKLKKLSLIQMNISNFEENTFEYLKNTLVEGIALAFNDLSILNGKVFRNLPHLTHLGLNNNSISEIVWDGLGELKVLHLRYNKLSSVPDFCDNSTSAVPALYVLDLGGNRLNTLSPKRFSAECLPSLRNLSLDENPFRVLPDNTFSNLPKLKRLSLTWLTQNDIKFSRKAFKSSSLIHLYIANHLNKFTSDPNAIHLFEYCPSLEVLDMTRIRLVSDDGSFVKKLLTPLVNLKKLVLQSTHIHRVPQGLFQTMPNLTNLNLQSCKVTVWTKDTFKNLPSLKMLYLSKNKITLINDTSFPAAMLQQIERLDLYGNPFACNCDAFWFKQWIKNNRHKLYHYPWHYDCNSPKSWQGKSIDDYNPTYSTCHPVNPYIVLGVSVGSAFLFILVVGVVLYQYRWHIKHYIYLLRARRGYERIPQGEDYVYDAFVAYNADDRVWIISQLIPQLERKENHKLCLHERDFKVGTFIVDNIVENISRSRKIIIILSNSFAKSQWCQFEMATAQLRHVQDGGTSVIVVMLEDIKSTYMTNSLRVLLTSTTYIPWTIDAVGRETFWSRLTDAVRC